MARLFNTILPKSGEINQSTPYELKILNIRDNKIVAKKVYQIDMTDPLHTKRSGLGHNQLKTHF